MIALGVVGLGKIAHDQHLPTIAAASQFTLAATASPGARIEGVPGFDSLSQLLTQGPRLDAVAICTPPGVRHAIAAAALTAGLDVLLEKPPASTLSQTGALADLAEQQKRTIFAAWHSRFAAGVAPAHDWLATRTVRSATITWKEDIRRWHPGQEWILEAGGFGVLDPGINALSILTAILPEPVLLQSAEFIVPEGRQSPIAATLQLRSGDAPIEAVFDFRATGPQLWRIVVETDAGELMLDAGGASLSIAGVPAPVEGRDNEYPRLYTRFAELIQARSGDLDDRPMRLVADAMLIATRVAAEPFFF